MSVAAEINFYVEVGSKPGVYVMDWKNRGREGIKENESKERTSSLDILIWGLMLVLMD